MKVSLLYPGDRAMRDRCDLAESRFADLFHAFAAAGIEATPAIYHDDFADEVEAQLQGARLVLVWCNPIQDGRRRDRLDAMLRRLAAQGVAVSAHPDAIPKLGTKDVLVETRHLPFGSDVHRLDSLQQLTAELPLRLQHGARVLKQHRGHSGIGVWRVERAATGNTEHLLLKLRHAERGSDEELVDFATLLDRMAPYFTPEAGGHMIDQAWQPRLAEGMVRAYLVHDRVTGFGHQAINALHPDSPQGGPRLYHGPDMPQYQSLKQCLESSWVELLRESVGLPRGQLPLLWDCDFMLGESPPGEPDRYVLCEINVSSVSPFPPSSVAPLVEAVKSRLSQMVNEASDEFGIEASDVSGLQMLDVRRAVAFERAQEIIAGAAWRDPRSVDDWGAVLPMDRDVVVYCVHGHEVSRGTALRLRAQGVKAHFLRGGIEGWKTAGMPVQPKKGSA